MSGLAPGREIDGRYRVEKLLGQGGFGEVLQCFDPTMDRSVAVKLLKAQVDNPGVRKRFDREARVTAALQHDHIVRVFDHGVDSGEGGGRAFVVYELLEGFDLERIVDSQESIPEKLVVEWGVKIAEALHYAHQNGVVHRDVKPANVFLKGGTEPLLVDFGIARADEGRTALTAEGVLLGSPAYMAPELWKGEKPSPASDQYAWAASLYEVLYRQLPYPGPSPTEIMEQVLSGREVTIPDGYRGRRKGLEAALLKGLSVDPADRYPDTAAFGDALQEGMRASLREVLEASGVPRRADLAASGSYDPERFLETAAGVAPAPAGATMDSSLSPLSKGGRDASTMALSAVHQGESEPTPRRVGVAAVTFVAVAGVLWGMLGPGDRDPPPTSPPTVTAAPTEREVPSPMNEAVERVAALEAAERILWVHQGVETEAGIPDRIARFTYHTTERSRKDINHFKRYPVFEPKFLGAWERFLAAVLHWLQSLRSWEERHELLGRALSHPDVVPALDRVLYRTMLFVLESARNENVEWKWVRLPKAPSRGDLGMVMEARAFEDNLARFLQEFRAFVVEVTSIWPSPPRELRLVEDLYRVVAPAAGRSREELASEDRSPEDLIQLLRDLQARFLVSPPSNLTYVEGKAFLYLLNTIIIDADGPLEWEERSQLLGEFERRLLEHDAWKDAAVLDYRTRLLARCLFEESRLHRLWDVNLGPIPLDDGRQQRVFDAVLPELRKDPDLMQDVGAVTESLLSSAGGPFYPGPEDARSSMHWQRIYSRWKKKKF